MMNLAPSLEATSLTSGIYMYSMSLSFYHSEWAHSDPHGLTVYVWFVSGTAGFWSAQKNSSLILEFESYISN
jgi:hypothetical protein